MRWWVIPLHSGCIWIGVAKAWLKRASWSVFPMFPFIWGYHLLLTKRNHPLSIQERKCYVKKKKKNSKNVPNWRPRGLKENSFETGNRCDKGKSLFNNSRKKATVSILEQLRIRKKTYFLTLVCTDTSFSSTKSLQNTDIFYSIYSSHYFWRFPPVRSFLQLKQQIQEPRTI